LMPRRSQRRTMPAVARLINSLEGEDEVAVVVAVAVAVAVDVVEVEVEEEGEALEDTQSRPYRQRSLPLVEA